MGYLVPDRFKPALYNAAIQSLKETYEFLARLFINFGSTDKTFWIVGIVAEIAETFSKSY